MSVNAIVVKLKKFEKSCTPHLTIPRRVSKICFHAHVFTKNVLDIIAVLSVVSDIYQINISINDR